ncbi:MAG: AraC family transcriptional regulator [Pseudomonadota bacterium]
MRPPWSGPIFAAMQDKLDAMRDRVMRHTDGIRRDCTIPRLGLGLVRQPSLPVVTLYEPMICLVLQGAKRVMIGDCVLRYDPACSFIASLDLPASGHIIEATPDKPFVAVSLTLDRAALAALIPETASPADGDPAGFAVTPVTPALLEAWENLIALLDAPQDVPVLAPLREREILYRLLQGPQGGMLRQIARDDSRLSQVRRAIQWLQANFDRKMRIDMLAGIAGMSVPSFHRHFKAATAMSPLQFQKSLRLQAARRLLATHAEASRAAYTVGYESASQFSREYARMFGAPPSRDVERLRGTADGPVAVI